MQPKRVGLLAYLAAAPDRMFTPREALLELFWKGDKPERARSSLRTALHSLRTEIGDVRLLTQGNASVGIDRKHVTSDVADFRDRIDAGAYAEALALVKGEFLAGIHIDDASGFQDWVEEQRTQHKALASSAAIHLARDEHSRHNFAAAIFWLRRAESFLGRDEGVSALLMGVLAEVGNVASALHEFNELSLWLRAHLDAEPSSATDRLARQIREGLVPSTEQLFIERMGDSPSHRPQLRKPRTEFVSRGGMHPLHFRDLVELADDVIFRADVFGYFVYTNPAGCRLLGLGMDKIVGRLFTDFVRADYRVRTIEFYLRQVHEGAESSYFEFPVVRADGEIRWVGQRVQLVRDEGTVVGIQSIARDITANRRAKEIGAEAG